MTDYLPWTAVDVAEATQGVLLTEKPEKTFYGVSIDSRSVSQKNLFVAIKGENHDGHCFLDEVIDKGVMGVVISKQKISEFPLAKWKTRGIVCVAVTDTTRALGDMAAFNRKRSKISVIAVTGSNGKTTTRKMTTAVIRKRYPTLWSYGNFNNEIGLSLTLLRLKREHQWAVLEMGANHPGEIARLTKICRPDIGMITNIGPAHLEGFSSLDGVAAAKAELLDHMAADGTAVLNADDPRVISLKDKAPGNVLLYGVSEDADIRATIIEENGLRTSFRLSLPKKEICITLKIPGSFMVANALAAASSGYLAGVSPEAIKSALENDFYPAPGRMNIFETPNKIHVIDDTYNANPGSMAAALITLRNLKKTHRAIFVAGDMLELGQFSDSLHKNIGELAAKAGINRLYAVGNFSLKIAEGAMANGMERRDIYVGSKTEILEDMIKWLLPGDWILVKGSRSMGMEKIVDGLKSGIKTS